MGLINDRILKKALLFHSLKKEPPTFQSFSDFVEETYFSLYNMKFIMTKYHLQVCELLEKCAKRELPPDVYTVVINISPRFGKSILATLYVAYCYVRNSAAKFLYVTYSKDLSFKFSREVKDILKDICGLSSRVKKDAVGIWTTEQRGEFLATTIGGSATGFGASDVYATPYSGDVLFDDANKISDTFYESRRRKVIENYNNTFVSRRNNLDRVPLIHFQQRVHPQDLSGYILTESSYKYVHLKIPALDSNGESIFPQRISTQSLLNLKDNDPTVFAAQWMQEPLTQTGGFFNVDNIQTVSRKQFDEQYKHQIRFYVRSWDLAGVGSKGSEKKEDILKRDWTRGVKFGVMGDAIIITDMVSQRGLVEANDVLINDTAAMDGYDTHQVFPLDPAAAGAHYGEFLKSLPGVRDKQSDVFPQNGSKIIRATPTKALINQRKVFIVMDDGGTLTSSEQMATWQVQLLGCIGAFPFGVHDDATDALTLGMLYIKDKCSFANFEAMADFFSGNKKTSNHQEVSVFGDSGFL